MTNEVIQVSEINLPAIQADIFAIQEQLTELIEYIQLTNTILLYSMAILVALGVCILFYKLLKIFL